VNETVRWLEGFQRRAGRRLRVLHIGNIANNAYNNAKIQRAAGIDADVLSHDYYHIMACPEWEDADFTGAVGDDMFPDWWGVDLHGFKRPRWFAQGPLDACIRHLLAQGAGTRTRAFWWWMLEAERWLLSRKSRLADTAHWLIERMTGARVAYGATPLNAAVPRRLASAVRGAARSPLAIALFVDGPLDRLAFRLARLARAANIGGDAVRHTRARQKRRAALESRANALLAPLGRCLRPDDLDWPFASWWHPYLRLLLTRYDIIQAYATYTAMPFLVGGGGFIAYEHGTIRAIPFEDDAQGRLCAATYRAADAVLVTNSDNLHAATRLGLAASQTVCLPHAFDSGKLLRYGAAHARPRAGGRRVSFFSPSRQDWRRTDPSLSKGNDRAFRALADLARRGYDFRAEFIEWGTDLEASKALVAELGLQAHVVWLPKMKKRALWAKYLETDCVIDQFVVPAIGGVTFEAMMLGRRVISSIDDVQAKQFFGEAPPLFSATDVAQIVAALLAVAEDPEDHARRGRANQDWMQRYHSRERILALQADVYRRVLGEAAPRDLRPWSRRLTRASARGRAARAVVHAVATLDTRSARFWRALLQVRFRGLRRVLRSLAGYLYHGLRNVLRRAPALESLLKRGYGCGRRLWHVAVPVIRLPWVLRRYRLAWAPRPARGSLPCLPREIVMLVVSDLRIDPRVERAARAAVAAGYRVKVIWPEPVPPYHAEQSIDWGPGISFRPLAPEHASFAMAFPWVFGQGMLDAACEERPFAFHCHDLTTAMIGLTAARKAGAYCVCDFHEWYSENASWDIRSASWKAHRPFKRHFFRAVERLVMSRADAVITVCDSIARELSETLSPERRPVTVIRNIPPLERSGTAYRPLREELGLKPGQFLLLWQGGTGPTRMIEPIIRALAYSPKTVFVIRGPSLDLFGEGYRAEARAAGVADRLILLAPVRSNEVVSAAVGADAGIWTLPNLSKNFYYALPNKIFEYLASGLPVLAAYYPEARKLVEGNGVGLCFDPYDRRSIAAQINRMAEDPALLRSFREAVPRALENMNAAREWEKLIALYGALEGGPK
jgi:glycosyltransferase involved in cell wall biosynthesis